MSRLKRLLCLVALACCIHLGLLQPSASASTCGALHNRTTNTGYAWCGSGFGYIKVIIECQSGSWPYYATIEGPWVWSTGSGSRSSATCPGGSWLTLVGSDTIP
jgi:hypothetical protein